VEGRGGKNGLFPNGETGQESRGSLKSEDNLRMKEEGVRDREGEGL